MARSQRTLRWHPPDLSRFGFTELRRFSPPAGCRVDALDLRADDLFGGMSLFWATEKGASYRAVVERAIDRWWRDLGRGPGFQPLARVLTLHAARRPAEPPLPNKPNLRALIAQAIRELEPDFAAAIARKLDQVMGTPRRVPPKKAVLTPSSPMVPRFDHSASIRSRLLAVLSDGKPRGRSQLLADAKLFEDQVPHVLKELRALRAEGRVVMTGPRAAAKYVWRQALGE